MANEKTSPLRIAGADAAVIEDTDLFQLSCGTEGCPANCCTASAPIVLNPYEISRICRGSGMTYEDLLDVVDTERAAGFPLILLPRDPACHFRTGEGCRIYSERPLACRLFPLGRVYDGIRSRLVMPGRNACSGLGPAPAGTVADFLVRQDAGIFMRMSDRWIEFVNEIEQLPLEDKPLTSIAFHQMVYNPDAPPVPATENADAVTSLEERFILRMETARELLPRFLFPDGSRIK